MKKNIQLVFLSLLITFNINASSNCYSNSDQHAANYVQTEDTLNYYLCAYFPNSSEKKLHYATSIDGYNFKAIHNNPILIDTVTCPNMVVSGDNQDQVLRDPMILREPSGKFRLIATYSWKKSPMITYESINLKDWTNGRLIYPTDTAYHQTWAPQVEYDVTSKQYIVYWTGCIGGVWKTAAIDYMTSPDFEHWSSVKTFSIPGMDASMFSANSKHYLVVRDHGIQQIASSGSILGPYNKNIHFMTHDDVEGPFVYKIANQNVWILFGDLYKEGGPYKLYKSTDGENWSTLNTNEYYFPTGVDGVRHGSVMAISKAEYILLTGTVPDLSPLTGLRKIDGVGTAPNTYSTIRSAIIDLNARGVGVGGVNFQMVAGYTYIANSVAENLPEIKINATAKKPILFVKIGNGVNPKICWYSSQIAMKEEIKVSGSCHIKFINIDMVSVDNL